MPFPAGLCNSMQPGVSRIAVFFMVSLHVKLSEVGVSLQQHAVLCALES